MTSRRYGMVALIAPLGLAAAAGVVASMALGTAAAAAPRVAPAVNAPAPGQPGQLQPGWTNTEWGPLGPADRDLLVKVRLAGLWEMPAGELAQERAASDRVKVVGRTIASQHAALDEQVVKAAAQLQVPLPDVPNGDQQSWLAQLAAVRGDAFDRTYANLLRAAHGKVFSVIAGVRAGTRNEMVRSFAETANKAVMTHMQLLESTSFVSYTDLPAPPNPPAAGVQNAAAAAAQTSAVRFGTPVDPAIIWLVLAVALIAGTATTARVIRPR
ncbi:MAG TPA: DUF4142 domain-containing protein [Pilimelia sp.]|nr:DUF4142 domain-containing protein [Pilimelia sp.]